MMNNLWIATVAMQLAIVNVAISAESCRTPVIIEPEKLLTRQPELVFDPDWIRSLGNGARITVEAVLREPEYGEIDRIQVLLGTVEQHWTLPLGEKHFAGRTRVKLRISVQAICDGNSVSPTWRSDFVISSIGDCEFVSNFSVSRQDGKLVWEPVKDAQRYEVCYTLQQSRQVICKLTELNSFELSNIAIENTVTVTPFCRRGRGASKLMSVDSR